MEIIEEGYLVATATPIGDCTGFALLAPAELNRMTYWADLAQSLAPGTTEFWVVMGALLGMHATFYGFKMVRDLLRRPHQ